MMMGEMLFEVFEDHHGVASILNIGMEYWDGTILANLNLHAAPSFLPCSIKHLSADCRLNYFKMVAMTTILVRTEQF